MNKPLCFLMFTINPICYGMTYLPEKPEYKEARIIEEVFTPINKEGNSTAGEISGPTISEDERNVILDINDPLVQEIIKRIVSTSIHDAFKNKELQKELANKNKCCTSSTKLKIALLTAMSSTATAVLTIILNNM